MVLWEHYKTHRDYKNIAILTDYHSLVLISVIETFIHRHLVYWSKNTITIVFQTEIYIHYHSMQ